MEVEEGSAAAAGDGDETSAVVSIAVEDDDGSLGLSAFDGFFGGEADGFARFFDADAAGGGGGGGAASVAFFGEEDVDGDVDFVGAGRVSAGVGGGGGGVLTAAEAAAFAAANFRSSAAAAFAAARTARADSVVGALAFAFFVVVCERSRGGRPRPRFFGGWGVFATVEPRRLELREEVGEGAGLCGRPPFLRSLAMRL